MKNQWKVYEISMRNRSKSSLEVSWALLGPLGVPYWRPGASREHLGSLLRASWSVMEASPKHLGARRKPHMDPTKSSPKTSQKNVCIYIYVYKYVCIHMYRCMYVGESVHVCMYICMCVCISMYVSMYANAQGGRRIHIIAQASRDKT